MIFTKEVIEEKQKLIDNTNVVLKKEFVGIDEQIDTILQNLRPWFLFPELQERPCIINLYGLTGTGKTSLVKRIVQLLGIENDLVYFNFASIHEMSGWEIEDNLEESLIGEKRNKVIVYDEFQYAATLDESGCENDNKKALKPFWELLDTGILNKKYDNYDSMNLKKLLYCIKLILKEIPIIIENGQWINVKECVKIFEDNENVLKLIGRCFNIDINEMEDNEVVNRLIANILNLHF